jgi:hypothetical protein
MRNLEFSGEMASLLLMVKFSQGSPEFSQMPEARMTICQLHCR